MQPRSIPLDAPAPFAVGDHVIVSSPVEGDTVTYQATVSAVSPIRDAADEGPITWLVDLYSPQWLPARLRQAAYDEAGNPDPSRAVLTFVEAGTWPAAHVSQDPDNRLTIGSDGGLYVGPEA
jgi:hypothetical protein